MTSAVLAIDPGKTGGLCFRFLGGDLQTAPLTIQNLTDVILDERFPPSSSIIIEGQRGTGRGTDFEYGKHYGELVATIRCLVGREPDYVGPQRWQFIYELPGGLPYAQRKSRLQSIAWELYPELQPTKATADAVLIYEWWRRKQAREAVA